MPALACALFDDNRAPIEISASTAVIDERAGLSTYTGNAKVIQGSLTLKGEKIQVFNTKKSVTKVIVKGSQNKPAHYQQNQVNQPRFVEARAQNITYFASKQIIRLQRDAHFVQGFNSFSSGILNYDIKNDKIIAKKSKDGTQRVKFKIKL
jgi:lipopolysaccharide export system protein LptA